jgi:hypothetical protein
LGADRSRRYSRWYTALLNPRPIALISFQSPVTDRLAYLNFVLGSLSSSLSVKLDGARATLKSLRDAETALTPRRNIRAGIQMQITRMEHDHQKGLEMKIFELKEQLKRAEHEDEPQEKDVELLKRKAVRESEQIKWEAIREVILLAFTNDAYVAN